VPEPVKITEPEPVTDFGIAGQQPSD